MNKTYLLLLCLISLVSCGPSKEEQEKAKAAAQAAQAAQTGDSIAYEIDMRTNLCFGKIYPPGENDALSYKAVVCVPCNALNNVEVTKIHKKE